MNSDVMTFGDTFRAIRSGDIGCIVAFMIECLIMAMALFAAAWWVS